MRAAALLLVLAACATPPDPPDTRPEKVAGGFTWIEGPLWHPDGYLLFSDIPKNAVYRLDGAGARVWLEPSGYTGAAPFAGREPGSNGLALDPSGRVVLCQHGDRRVVRVEADGSWTTLADRFEGRRLNSPNDCVFAPDGALWFTDPPFGLPGAFDDPARELDFCGVYRVGGDGRVRLATKELNAPNGIALSPDGRTLYASNADAQRPVVMAWPVRANGTLGRGRVLWDASAFVGTAPGNPDGMCVAFDGTLYVGGPGAVYVLSPGGRLLRRIVTGVATSNCTLVGDTLWITASTAIYRAAR